MARRRAPTFIFFTLSAVSFCLRRQKRRAAPRSSPGGARGTHATMSTAPDIDLRMQKLGAMALHATSEEPLVACGWDVVLWQAGHGARRHRKGDEVQRHLHVPASSSYRVLGRWPADRRFRGRPLLRARRPGEGEFDKMEGWRLRGAAPRGKSANGLDGQRVHADRCGARALSASGSSSTRSASTISTRPSAACSSWTPASSPR